MTELEALRAAVNAAQQLLYEANAKLIDAMVTVQVRDRRIAELEKQLAEATKPPEATEPISPQPT